MALPDGLVKRTLQKSYRKDGCFRILSLDGGGAKGFYTLGALKEIEALVGCPLSECFDLVFGTSTGSIIGTLIAVGCEVDDIHRLYRTHVPSVMKPRRRKGKSLALKKLADDVFGDAGFADVRTAVGIVATKWPTEKPMIFKGSVEQAHGRKATFVPGFGAKLGEAVRASCSAYPFFDRVHLNLANVGLVELADGGYCANNPALYALADAVHAVQKPLADIRLISVGVGVYPQPKTLLKRVVNWLPSVQLLQKVLEINTQSMEQLRQILFKDIRTVRISKTFERPELATDFLEHDLRKLNMLWQQGRESFAEFEPTLREYLVPEVPSGNP